MKEEKENWEELIRSKLYDFEVDTNPEDWEALSAKLNGGKVVRLSFYRKLTYTASAAAALALLLISGYYFLSNQDTSSNTLTTVEKPFQQDQQKIVEPVENVATTEEAPVENIVDKPARQLLAAVTVKEKMPVEADVKEAPPSETPVLPVADNEPAAQKPEPEKAVQPVDDFKVSESAYIADAASEVKRRRWGFGMGGGGYAIGSTTDAPVSSRSIPMNDDEIMRNTDQMTLRNGAQGASLFDPLYVFKDDMPPGKVKHKRPVSVGLGVSYYLTDRWALQSGVVYTLLRSNGNAFDAAGNIAAWKQNLHFLGIPLSLSYRIADWHKIRFYVSAGGMGELNVSGKRIYTVIVENLETLEKEKVRMTEPLWSVNARAGAVYPLWRFINLYAEGGASYYFDNNSKIVTIRSDKPFNVSLQAGIRLGF